MFEEISPSDVPYIIILDGSHTQIDGRRHIDRQYFKLKDAVHVPKINLSLLIIL